MSDIVFDLNRITRGEFRDYTAKINETEDRAEQDRLSAAMIAKTCVSWPFEQKVSVDGYMSLGLKDSLLVDEAFSEAMGEIGEKK